MTASPEEEKHRKSLRRWTIVFGAVAGVILLYAGYRFILRRAAEQARAEVRAAGFPVTFAELAALRPEIAPGPNAALHFDEAATKIKDAKEEEFDDLRYLLPIVGDGERPRRAKPLAGEQLAAVEKYIAANEEPLRLLHAAAAIEPCRFSGEFGRNWDGMGVDLEGHGRGSGLLFLDALRQAAKGEAGKAAAAIAALFRAGRALAEEPLLTSLLTGRRTEGGAIHALEHVLSTSTLPAADLESLAAAARAEEPERLRRATIGERAFVTEGFFAEQASGVFSAGSVYPEANWMNGTWGLVYRAGGCRELDLLRILERFERLIDAASLPLPERCPVAKQAAAEALSSTASRLLHPATCHSLEWISFAFLFDTAIIARLRAARAALAAERCRLARGKLPGKLEDLVPEFLDAVPEDPFDAKPIRWKLFPWGYAAYSVGPNKADDGGAELPAAGKDAGNDTGNSGDDGASGDPGSVPPPQARTRRDDVTFIVERKEH